ncbi:hypothetical protein QBC35DRAFT_468611 [Podospora australis]|uniref:Uncharacterized protein n=1 Tax=Podospora australis TaxID=1536484 RepID=A0AAN7ANL2_9PEZI|nr:hypothetical protein QBC35DRAFT_468611 [Podospora australis]
MAEMKGRGSGSWTPTCSILRRSRDENERRDTHLQREEWQTVGFLPLSFSGDGYNTLTPIMENSNDQLFHPVSRLLGVSESSISLDAHQRISNFQECLTQELANLQTAKPQTSCLEVPPSTAGGFEALMNYLAWDYQLKSVETDSTRGETSVELITHHQTAVETRERGERSDDIHILCFAHCAERVERWTMVCYLRQNSQAKIHRVSTQFRRDQQVRVVRWCSSPPLPTAFTLPAHRPPPTAASSVNHIPLIRLIVTAHPTISRHQFSPPPMISCLGRICHKPDHQKTEAGALTRRHACDLNCTAGGFRSMVHAIAAR